MQTKNLGRILADPNSIRPNLRLRRTSLSQLRKRTNRCLRRSGIRRRRRTMRGGRHPTRNTRPVIINRAARATAKDLLITQIPLPIIETQLRHFIREFIAVVHMVPRKQIILDPQDFVNGADERNLATQRQMWVRHHRLDPDILDIRHTHAEVDVLDVQGGSAHLPAVHHAVGPLALHNAREPGTNAF